MLAALVLAAALGQPAPSRISIPMSDGRGPIAAEVLDRIVWCLTTAAPAR